MGEGERSERPGNAIRFNLSGMPMLKVGINPKGFAFILYIPKEVYQTAFENIQQNKKDC